MASRAIKANRKEYDATRRQTRLEKWRAFLDEQKSKPCSDCGGRFHPAAMQFDHLGDKVRGISRMGTMARDKVLAEIAKCDLVCANCHAVRTWNRSHDIVGA